MDWRPSRVSASRSSRRYWQNGRPEGNSRIWRISSNVSLAKKSTSVRSKVLSSQAHLTAWAGPGSSLWSSTCRFWIRSTRKENIPWPDRCLCSIWWMRIRRQSLTFRFRMWESTRRKRSWHLKKKCWACILAAIPWKNMKRSGERAYPRPPWISNW